MAEQPLIDAARKLGVPLTGDQLDLEFCPTCSQPIPNRPLRCSGCKRKLTEDDIAVWNDKGKFGACCEKEALRWP